MAGLARRHVLQLLTTRLAADSPACDSAGLSSQILFKRWATKKAGGSTKNGRSSKPKFLGLKKQNQEKVIPGNIIFRQRGTRIHPGDFVGMGKDRTLYSLVEGRVRFERHPVTGRKWAHVDPAKEIPLHPLFRDEPETKVKPKRPSKKQQRMHWWKQDHTKPNPLGTVYPRKLPALCLRKALDETDKYTVAEYQPPVPVKKKLNSPTV